MNFPDIKVFNIAKTQVTSGMREWLDFLGADKFELDESATSPELVCSCAGRRCYKAFQKGLNPNVNKIRKEMTKYFDNILKSGHGSVLEHATYTFAIENLTRVATAELNRHRAGVAISEGSMRYIRFDDMAFWLPLSLRNQPDDDELTLERKRKSRDSFQHVIATVELEYKRLCEIWDIDDGNFNKKKKLTSMFRRMVPMGVCTGGVWTFNLRALRHIIALRTSEAAEEEIVHIVGIIAKMLSVIEPNIFGDFEQHGTAWTPKYVKV